MERDHTEIDVENAYLSISTEPSAVNWEISKESLVSDPTRSRSQAAIFASNARTESSQQSKQDPLARAVSRRGRPLSSLLWTDEFLSQTSNTVSVDISFEQRLLRGTTRIPPVAPLWTNRTVVRAVGTLTDIRSPEGRRKLAVSTEGEKLRVEHLRHAITASPVLTFTGVEDNSRGKHVYIYHNAIRAEVESLYTITSSLGKRKHDITNDDIVAFYSWLGVFGDFVRLYFCAFERFIINAIEQTSDMELYENMSSSKRKRSKLSIVRLFEEIEGLKRPMQVQVASRHEAISQAITLCDKLSMSLLKLIGDEIEQLPSLLTTYFHNHQIDEMFRQASEYLASNPSGSLLIVMLSVGSGIGSQARRAWLKRHVHHAKGQKAAVSATLVAQRWTRKFYETHTQYVRGFQKAENEYVRIFSY